MTIGRRQSLNRSTAVVPQHVELNDRGLFMRLRLVVRAEGQNSQRYRTLPGLRCDSSTERRRRYATANCRCDETAASKIPGEWIRHFAAVDSLQRRGTTP